MKNFLAVFDGYNLCKSTFEYAVLLAKKSNSRLTGVFLDAFFYHNYNLSKVLRRSSDPEAEMEELIVLGAYRRSKISRWFKHSLADVLMNTLDKPLFIAHH